MSLSGIMPFFRTELNTLNYREWKKTFDKDVPESWTRGDKNAYHLDLGSAGIEVAPHQGLTQYTIPIVVTLWFFGKRDSRLSVLDDAISDSETLIETILNKRATQSAFKNIEFVRWEKLPYKDTNDNHLRIEVEFDILGVFCDEIDPSA